MTRSLYLIRHGQCELSGTMLGQRDVSLTAEGEAQVESLVRHMNRIEVIVSSDLARARGTAEILSRRIGAPVVFDARFREISYGAWDGLSWSEIESLDPEGAKRKLEDWRAFTPSGGETFEAFEARVKEARGFLFERTERVIAVVAHLGVNAVLSGLPGLTQEYATAIEITLP